MITLLMVGDDQIWTRGQCDHMVSVRSTSNSDDRQYGNGQSSHVTVYAASDSVTVYEATVWQCMAAQVKR